MRLTQRILLTCGLLLAAATPSLFAADGGEVTVRAILVSASKQPGETDRSLSAYESTLRRILRFESFQQLGGGKDRAEIPGKGRVSLGQGQVLEFTTQSSRDDRIRVQLDWRDDSHSFMRTGLVLRPGVPAVLGGPKRGDGSVYALLVIAE
ncbi:MAG: hypothetical protein HOH58_07075 [Opitutaceae bacterium]|jgi:hypothetical protein|nr:hypothetical protein [Opitutaceae bacterium]